MSLFNVKVDISYLEHTLPVPLLEICKRLQWDVYIDFDIDRILVTTNRINDICVSMAWNKEKPIYRFFKKYSQTDHLNRWREYYKQMDYITDDINEAFRILLKDISIEELKK